MNFLTKAKATFLIVKAHKDISRQYNLLITTNDYLSENIYEKLEKSCAKLNDILTTYPEYNAKALNSLFFCNDDAKYIKEFSKGNYEKSLEVAINIIDKQKYGDLSTIVGISHVLNSLGELKARLDKEEYQQKYLEQEIVHIAVANQLFQKTDMKEGLINIGYNGNKMAIAYSHYLSGNKEEMMVCIKEQVNRFGLEEVLKHESGNRCPWFYKTISPKYVYFLTEVVDILSAPTKNKIKL